MFYVFLRGSDWADFKQPRQFLFFENLEWDRTASKMQQGRIHTCFSCIGQVIPTSYGSPF